MSTSRFESLEDRRLLSSSISGFVFLDLNNNGTADYEPGIANVKVTLTGTDANGGAVDLTAFTNNLGEFKFQGLLPGTYTLTEFQPAGYADGKDGVGRPAGSDPNFVPGPEFGTVSANDVISNIQIPDNADWQCYRFAERPVEDGKLSTATIGFWHNKNGQALIKACGYGLGEWLSTNFPNLYGSLDGKSSAVVAQQFMNYFNVKGMKLEAQIMAVALASYVTSKGLAGNIAAKYGFNVTDAGTGGVMVNVGANGWSLGFANNSSHTVLEILQAADDRAVNGKLFANNQAARSAANSIFTGINEDGDIG